MHPYFINPLERKTRLANVLRASYTLAGSVAHVSSAATAMVSISDENVAIICPKVLISALSEVAPKAMFITPQAAIKRPPSSDLVLWLYSCGSYSISAVLRKK